MKPTGTAHVRQRFRSRLKKDTESRHWVLLELHQRQTIDERADKRTKWGNHVGFSAANALHLSSLAEKLLTTKQLSAKDERTLVRMLPKYHLQFSRITLIGPPTDSPHTQKKRPNKAPSPTSTLQRSAA